MKPDDALSEVFNVEPIPKEEFEVVYSKPLMNITSAEKIDDDYDKARSNLHDLLIKGQESLNSAIEVAKQSEHPRAFEVVGNLMKQLADINQQLMDIHQQKKKLEEPGKEAAKSVTNNSIFVGSTAELNKMIKKMQGE